MTPVHRTRRVHLVEYEAMQLYSLIYISKPIKPFDTHELEELALEAQQKNATRDISGLLLYSNRFFLQVLEGDYEELSALYARLELDERHRDLELLTGAPASQRLFSGWSMGVLDISKSTRVDPELLREICDRAEADLDAAGQAAVVLLEIFRYDTINTTGMTLAP